MLCDKFRMAFRGVDEAVAPKAQGPVDRRLIQPPLQSNRPRWCDGCIERLALANTFDQRRPGAFLVEAVQCIGDLF